MHVQLLLLTASVCAWALLAPIIMPVACVRVMPLGGWRNLFAVLVGCGVCLY